MDPRELIELIRLEREARLRESRRVRLLLFVTAIALSVALLVVARQRTWRPPGAARPVSSPVFATRRAAAQPSPGTTPGGSTPALLENSEDLQVALFESAAPSVVFVTNIAIRRDLFRMNVFRSPQGTGTGFVWDAEGHVVTNYHVIEGANRVEVSLSDGAAFPAEVVGVHPDKDLAVLRIEADRPLRPIELGSSRDLRVGHNVYAIGNPFGLDQTMTAGIVSALGREIEAGNGRIIEDVIQTDAAINPGNSGGPLLDSSGRAIGVNTAIYSETGSYAGIGLAVPIDTVRRVVPQLIEHGKVIRPTLGVRFGSDRAAEQFGVEGVVIVAVLPKSGAERAGLRGVRRVGRRILLGDVVVGINERRVGRVDDLLNALERLQPGQKVQLRILRGEEELNVEVELGGQ